MKMATQDMLTLHQLSSRYAGRLRPAEVNLLHLWRKRRHSWYHDDDDHHVEDEDYDEEEEEDGADDGASVFWECFESLDIWWTKNPIINHGAQVLGPQWTSTNRSSPAGSTKVEKVLTEETAMGEDLWSWCFKNWWRVLSASKFMLILPFQFLGERVSIKQDEAHEPESPHVG